MSFDTFGHNEFPLPEGLFLENLRPTLRDIQTPYQDFSNGYVVNSEGQRIAVMREYIAYDSPSNWLPCFWDGLDELIYLREAGIQVANHLPFISKDPLDGSHTPYLLVEYVDGPVLKDEVLLEYEEECIELARKIGAYSLNAIKSGRNVLVDISTFFQYAIKDGEPTLIDLDMHQLKGSDSIAEQREIAAHVYEEVVEGNSPVSPEQPVDYQSIYEPMRLFINSED